MSDAGLLLSLAATLAVIAAPCPDNIPMLTRGVTMGRRAALLSAGGAAAGLVVHTALTAEGLSAIPRRSALAHSLVRYAGAAYLVYLGVRSLRERGGIALPGRAAPVPLSAVFRPKIAVFFLAYLPQFAGPAAGGLGQRLLALGLAFALLTWAVFSCRGRCRCG